MLVMKFGGTSIGGVEQIKNVVNIIRGRLAKHPVVVVSAMSKVTDSLYAVAAAAKQGEVIKMETLLSDLRIKHLDAAEQILKNTPEWLCDVRRNIYALCEGLGTTARAVCSLGELSDRSLVSIVSYGELLSSTLVGGAMNAEGIKTQWLDARKMIITDGHRLQGIPDMEEIQKRVPNILGKAVKDNEAVITQGFISAMADGEPTILGRGGSDYTASLIGMSVVAESIEIWTDVDGIMTSDPRVISNARKLEKVSFEEAAEMAHFGAKVLHPMTIEPAIKKNIPIRVLNSRNASSEGTQVLQSQFIKSGIAAISCKEKVCIVNIYSTKMIHVSGFLARVFDIFGKHHVSVNMIATSEANISLTVDNEEGLDKVVEELSDFAEVSVIRDKAEISIVGKQLSIIEHLMEKCLSNLNNTHVYMVSQSMADISMCLVVDGNNVQETVKQIHEKLFD